uniref:Rad50/SbcC-type AAA domain-containing protein n=1 Tax=Fagus sylvatica TaxID=28930 RepID=A0A2N9ED29_FAGSY
MADSRAFPGSLCTSLRRSSAGTIRRIRLENFMCHSNVQIEFGEWVNFITGQNGSGKSAILTALCVAFGCRAKGTQRASTLKDFIKTGCRNLAGRKVSSRKDDLREIVEHFNIDVENPCVIMSQDKSREFLHSGNDKDKFKATLLQQVNDLLKTISEHLKSANALVHELEESIKPMQRELDELQGKIKNMEHVEEISQRVQQLKKKLAWSWVYDVDKQLEEQRAKIGKLKDRIPACQAKIDQQLSAVEELREQISKKKAQIACMMEKTSEVRRMKDELRQTLSLATKEKLELEEEYGRKGNQIHKMMKHVRFLEQQIQDIHEQHAKYTQAEESEIEEKLKGLQYEVDAANSSLGSLKEEESALLESVNKGSSEISRIADEIEDIERKRREIENSIRELNQHQTNKVTAFGGDRVINLLRAIERHQERFKKPPIGPIGAHLTLVNGDTWASAVENAIGRLLNAFIVSNHKDALVLRGCAREANYSHLQIVIYDFARPRLDIRPNMLPQTNHPTTLSVLQTENHIVFNVLVDMGDAERQVLVRDYENGKAVAFEKRIPNLKEVYTLDGYKMFSRGSVQTTLPPNKKQRSGRLCSSFDDQIKDLQRDASNVKEEAQQRRRRKRDAEESLQGLQEYLQSVKRRRLNAERILLSKKLALKDVKNAYATEASASPASNVDELHQEISKVHEEVQEKKMLLETLQVRMNEAEVKANELKVSFENLCESAKGEIDAFDKAENDLIKLEQALLDEEAKKTHYEGLMNNRVVSLIKEAEAHYQELEKNRVESCRKASIICPESEIEALGGCDGSTPEQLSAQLTRLNQRLQHESQRYSESIDDLRMLYEEKECKISKKQKTYKAFREKLDVKMPQDASSSSVRDTRGLSGGERSFSTLCFALALHEMTEAPFRAMDEFDVFMDAVSRKISLDTLVDFAVAQGSQWIFITPHDIRYCI